MDGCSGASHLDSVSVSCCAVGDRGMGSHAAVWHLLMASIWGKARDSCPGSKVMGYGKKTGGGGDR